MDERDMQDGVAAQPELSRMRTVMQVGSRGVGAEREVVTRGKRLAPEELMVATQSRAVDIGISATRI